MRRRILAGVAAVIALVLLIGAWQLGLLTPEPDEVNLADAVAGEIESSDADAEPVDESAEPEDTTTTTAETATTQTTAAPTAAGGAAAPCAYDAPAGAEPGSPITELAALDGTWTVKQSDSTFAGYRIDEILSGADFTAVGRTSGVSGTILIEGGADGATLSAADIAVDLVGLTSDSRIRDDQLKRQALETGKFPTGCFSLTTPIPIDQLPADGATFSAEAEGTLHVHGVDQPVMISIESTTADGLLFVIGSIDLALADFNIEKPSAPSVADVSDTAVMEFSLVLSR